jgi:predicted nucleotidyltransferase
MLNEDYRDISQSLSDERVRFLLVGAYALAAHGFFRATMDIDIMTSVSGLVFEEAFRDSVLIAIEGIEVHVLSRQDLMRNKRAAGRTKDLADVEALGTLLDSTE